MSYRSHSSSLPFQREILANSFAVNRILFSLLIPAISLVCISLAVFYSIDIHLFQAQLVFLLIGIFAYFFFLNIDYRIFGYFSKYLYIGMIILLALLFFIGFEAKGAVRWVNFLGVSVQFSELIKPFYVIVMAYFLSHDKSRSFGKFLLCLAILFPVFYLTLKQPDLGNAIIYVLVTIFMMLMSGFSLWYFVFAAIVVLIPLPLLFHFLHGYQKARLLSFVNVTQDPFGSSYNAIQALIAIGSGGLSGRGFSNSTQSILHFLPERHTDFIFATIAEHLGFLGALVLLGIFAYLLFRLYRISEKTSDTFSYLVVTGFYFLLFIHIFFNVGMNIGLLPIVGITLPFVSYGGSSLLTNFIILGIVSSVNFEFKRHHSIEIR